MEDSVSEPGYWQARYESGEDRWDKGEPSPPLLEYTETHLVEGDVLVPGCGAGHDVRALALRGARAVGIDFAQAAIERACSFPKVACERFELADFLSLPDIYAGRFDWIFEHTCFCAIAPNRRRDYVQSCYRALRPGGRVLAVFYLEPGGPQDEGPPFGVTAHELDEFFSTAFEPQFERVPARAYPGREGRELLRVLRRRS